MRLMWIYRSHRPEENYYQYTMIWNRFVAYPGVGDVEYPTSILISMDAQNGELDRLLYKEQPAAMQISAPTISKEEAERIAADRCKPKNVVTTRANLMVYRGMDPGNPLPPVLAWHVRFYGAEQPESCSQYAMVDANTGKVLWALLFDNEE